MLTFEAILGIILHRFVALSQEDKLKKLALIFTLVLFVCALVSCDKAETDDSFNPAYNSSEIAVGSNWSFIDLNDVDGSPSDNVELIAKSIYNWEQNNPGRVIVSLQVFHETFQYTEHIDGISIYSKPK